MDSKATPAKRKIQTVFLGELAMPVEKRVNTNDPHELEKNNSSFIPHSENIFDLSSSSLDARQLSHFDIAGLELSDFKNLTEGIKSDDDCSDDFLPQQPLPLLDSKLSINSLPPINPCETSSSHQQKRFLEPFLPKEEYILDIAQESSSIIRIEGKNSSKKSCRFFGKTCLKTEWTISVRGQISYLTANKKWVVSCFSDNKVLVHSTQTGRLITPLQLGAALSYVHLLDDICVLITVNAELFSLSLDGLSLIVEKSFAFLLSTPEVKLIKLSVSDQGIPLISLSDGNTFVFSKNLDSWLGVNIGFDSFSDLLKPLHFMADLVPNGLIASIYPIITNYNRKTPNKYSLTDQLNNSLEQTQLESLLEASKSLNSPLEFRFLSALYLQNLAENGNIAKLSEVLRQFKKSTAHTCGLDFETIMSDIEPLFRSHNIDRQTICDDSSNSDEEICLSFLD